ncbi:MAG: hypothetical protein SO369_09010 [Treponema sp.]|nr:hypothetical protein [Treponema sp.]
MDLGGCQCEGGGRAASIGQMQGSKLHHGAKIFPNGATAWKSAETSTWQTGEHRCHPA